MSSHIYLYIAQAGRDDSHTLLQRAVTDYCHQTNQSLPDLTVIRLPSQKPRLSHAPHIHFSVSHSGDYWLCAIADQEVGLDVQQHKALDAAKLAQRYFSAEESAHIAAHPQSFFTLWTAKESYVKYTGTGIAGQFKAFSVIENGQLRATLHGASLIPLEFADGYSLCLCCQFPGELHRITI